MIRTTAAFILLSLLCVLTSSGSRTVEYLPEQAEVFIQALSQVGLNPEDVRISDSDLGLWGGEKYRTRLHQFLYDNPWKTSAYTRSFSNGLLKNKDSLRAVTTSAFQRIDCGVRLGLVGDELAAEKARVDALGERALAVALSELTGQEPGYYCWIPDDHADAGTAAKPANTATGEPTELQQDYAQLPLEVRQAAALVLFTTPRILRYREEALTTPILELGLNPQEVYQRVFDYTINTFEEEDDTSGHEVIDDLDDVLLLEKLMDNVDWNLLSTGATLAAITAQAAQEMMAEISDTPWQGDSEFTVRTPLGMVMLRTGAGATNPPYLDSDVLLLIDTDGNDHYFAPIAATPSYAHPLSIVIDLNGDDVYQAAVRDDLPSNAAGVFGYGVLIDVNGNDRHGDRYGGGGFGLFGYGLLADLNGDDTYDGWGNCQGCGVMGAGVLLDNAGDDLYHAFKYSQAYAGTRGTGLLIDVAGNDKYLADMDSHFNGGLYGPDHHVHFCQGSAFGRRGDFVDGHSWAGGVALLLDGGDGADTYTGDCYVQGNSYWYAVGMLVDKGGDDVYRCAQYSQASAPHFSIGILQDEAGDDRYTSTRRQSIGHGRDWSLVWFEDVAGNDFYQGARTTLGCSHVNSISVFWDRAGNDTYLCKGPGLGESELSLSGSPRDWLLTLGLFVDGGGHDQYFELTGDPSYAGSDTYPGDVTDTTGLLPLELAGNGTVWVRTAPSQDAPGFISVGIDSP